VGFSREMIISRNGGYYIISKILTMGDITVYIWFEAQFLEAFMK
jgi:hypothetical protein